MCETHRNVGVEERERAAAPRGGSGVMAELPPSRQTTLAVPSMEERGNSSPIAPALPPSRFGTQPPSAPAKPAAPAATQKPEASRQAPPPAAKAPPALAKPAIPPTAAAAGKTAAPVAAPTPERAALFAIVTAAFEKKKLLPRNGGNNTLTTAQEKAWGTATLKELFAACHPAESLTGKDWMFEGNGKGPTIVRVLRKMKDAGLKPEHIPSFMGGQKMS